MENYFLELQLARSIGKCDDPKCPDGVKCLRELTEWRDAGAYANATLVHNGHTNCQFCGFGGWVSDPKRRCHSCLLRLDETSGSQYHEKK